MIPVVVVCLAELLESPTTAVGQDEDSLPSVWGSDIGRSYSRPLRVEPDFGQITEHSVEAQSNVSCDILQEQELGSHFASDAENLGPEVSRVVGSLSLACDAEWLAGITGNDSMNSVTPRAAIEGSGIRPNRRWMKSPVFHPRCQDFDARGFPLDHADCSSAWKRQSDAEIESSDSSADAE